MKKYEKVKRLIKKASNYPLYIKMIYNIISDWPSFYEPDETFDKLVDMDECIKYIFKNLENDYGKFLVERCLYYLTMNRESGIS